MLNYKARRVERTDVIKKALFMKKHHHNQSNIRDLLKDYGLRYSKPREAILSFFQEQSMHVSAEGVYLALKKRGENLSLSTVYLNLNVLTEAGIIREFTGSNGEALYDSNIHPHHHLICKETGKVIDVPALEIDGMPLGKFLKEKIEAQTGWRVEEPEISLLGVSPDATKHH